MTWPIVRSLQVKEQLEGVTAIWCKCSSFFGVVVWNVAAQSILTQQPNGSRLAFH